MQQSVGEAVMQHLPQRSRYFVHRILPSFWPYPSYSYPSHRQPIRSPKNSVKDIFRYLPCLIQARAQRRSTIQPFPSNGSTRVIPAHYKVTAISLPRQNDFPSGVCVPFFIGPRYLERRACIKLCTSYLAISVPADKM
jgi:hypothetical protein